MTQRAVAVAHPNIALAKYWGKLPDGPNLPAVPSLSLTLAGMSTRTEIGRAHGAADTLRLDGQPVTGRPLARVTALLDRVWHQSGRGGERPALGVESRNDFPTAAGLASSASAFAALAVAANAALGAGCTPEVLSSVARSISASASRSLFGGFVALGAGEPGDEQLGAEPVAPPEHWDVRLVVAVTTAAQKEVGSTEGMLRTAASSPLYRGWIEAAPAIFARVRAAVLGRDLGALGSAMEQSALAMHATMLAADPGLVYWNGATVEAMHLVRWLRAEGIEAYFTIDAGPHLKVLAAAEHASAVAAALDSVGGVLRTIVARPGPGARLAEGDA